MEKKNQERSIELKKKTTSKLKVKKNNHRLGKEKQKKSLEVFLKNKNYLYVIVVVINILFTIFMARQNKINYVNITGSNVMLGENNYLYFGRNYINLVIIVTIQTIINHHENIISFPLNNFITASIIIFIETIIIEIAINIENMYSALPCPKL